MRRNLSISQFRYPQNQNFRFNQRFFFSSEKSQFPAPLADPDDPQYVDIPKPRRDKSERKPYPTPMKILIQRAKKEKELRKIQPCRVLENPPENGLLVPELIPVAHKVYRARECLISGLNQLAKFVKVQKCRFCFEVHIGAIGHGIRTCTGPGSGTRSATHVWQRGRVHNVVFFPKCFHLDDRVGKPRVIHNEWHRVKRIPAILELCIQAGVDLEKYPTKRRTKPVYSLDGRIVDFEAEMAVSEQDVIVSDAYTRNDHLDDPRELSVRTMGAWFDMVAGAKSLMEKYNVWTCGYCPEVQVGPKGHKVRMCKASKHQTRDGLHAWQEATIDDLVGPNYVWHVRDPNGPALANNLKRFYGKAPAVVELCVQAGAPVPEEYRSMMRLDVVPPERDEVDLVA